MFLTRSLRLFVLASLFGVLLVSSAALAADQPTISPRLHKAIGDQDFAWRNTDGSLTVWVFFQDKGYEGAALLAALDQAEAQLSERSAWRRGKVTPAGQRLVNAGDLPVFPSYLQQVKATGAIFRRESRWLNAASFTVTDDQVRVLAELPFVRKTDLVARFRHRPLPIDEPASANQADKNGDSSLWTIDYGGNLAAMEQASVPAVHDMGFNGQGVIVGILDTGFHTSHEALAGIPVLASYDFVNDDENVDNEPDDPPTSKDHGTKTMSTLMGNMPGQLVAPAFGASAVLAKTEDVSQEVPIEEDQWVAGLEWAETYGVDIVSSSLGYSDWYDFSDMDGNTAVTTIAAALAAGRGIVVVNSAGNERGTSWNHIIAPADGYSVITVGAVDSGGVVSYFSSPGPSYDGRIKPDVSALGVSNTVANPDDDYGYVTASGTSFSCPLTSGVAALILSRAPGLTPMQVREALRETAHLADNPDNDFGWGIINAYEAILYFGPNINHTPLSDTESTGTPYTVSALITDRSGLDTASLHYRINDGSWLQTAMTPTGETDIYAADIPGQSSGTVVDYYLTSVGSNGVSTSLPVMAPTNIFTFEVGTDVTPPGLQHIALLDQALIIWPPTLQCYASDNLGLDRVEIVYQINGGAVMGPHLFNDDGDDHFSLLFPILPDDIQVDDSINYTITAIDLAGIPNQTVSGPHDFVIIDALGLVLVLDDGAGDEPDTKYGPDKQPMQSRDEGKSNATDMANWLLNAGYVADVMPADGAALADFQSYQLVVLSAGDNTNPVASAPLRGALRSWANSGGKLLIESGEIGYDTLITPSYPDFAAEVLHAAVWDNDIAGDLKTAQGQQYHRLLNLPHLIDPVVGMNYTGYGDQDAIRPALDAYAVMTTEFYPDDSGILVYDDNLAPQSAQVVYFAFNVAALQGDAGKHLTLNSAQFLLAAESGPNSSLSGTVSLATQADYSGVLVSVGSGHSTLSAADGSWTIDGLYCSHYSLEFSKVGWGTQTMEVELLNDQHLTGLDVTLLSVIQVEYSEAPGATIPDNSCAGISSLIVVPEGESDLVAGVTVDVNISHTYIGDLTVRLVGPGGQLVSLHNRSGSSTDNLQGNWPATLTVDGPGALEDFIDSSNAGTWVLVVADHVGSDTGVLNSWGLNFLILGQVSGVGENSLPTVTRLNANVPNPFNPMTKISFDLARSGSVQLGIYDLRGRMVRRLVREHLTAGSHTVRWNGMDDGGRSVSSGVYLYRLESADGAWERKMVLVR